MSEQYTPHQVFTCFPNPAQCGTEIPDIQTDIQVIHKTNTLQVRCAAYEASTEVKLKNGGQTIERNDTVNSVWAKTSKNHSLSLKMVKSGMKEMFYLMMHSTHLIYSYMASDIL